MYTPLLLSWAGGIGLQGDDAANLVQDVLTTPVRQLPQFDYDPGRSFRGWVRTVTLNRWRSTFRTRTELVLRGPGPGPEDVAAPDGVLEIDEGEYNKYLLGRALALMTENFQTSTWKACWEHVVGNRSTAEVGAELGMSEGAVYAATTRVLRLPRRELQGLLDSD